MSNMPEQMFAWPFSGWDHAGGHWGKRKATMPETEKYIRDDHVEAQLTKVRVDTLREAMNVYREHACDETRAEAAILALIDRAEEDHKP